MPNIEYYDIQYAAERTFVPVCRDMPKTLILDTLKKFYNEY